MNIEPTGDVGRWWVEATRGDTRYLVDLAELGGNGKCDCTDFRTRQQSAYDAGSTARCKHIEAVRELAAEALLEKYITQINQNDLALKSKNPYVGIPSKSEKRIEDDKVYMKLRKQFLLANPKCHIFSEQDATDVHHTRGRAGDYLLDVDTWIAVSRAAHNEIHDNPAWAKERGYMKDRV